MSTGYLLASLPMLFPDRPPAISADAFVAACRAALPASAAETAERLLIGYAEPDATGWALAWQGIEAALLRAIGRKRLERRGGGAQAEAVPPETSACPVWLERAVAAAFESSSDPLTRERALLRVYWAAADDLAGFDPMARGQVFAYAVKLRLALRLAALDEARGKERLEEALPEAPRLVRQG